MKQSNYCGVNGLAIMRRETKETSAVYRDGVQMSTKFVFLTRKAKENPKYKFMLLTYLFAEDFLKSCRKF